MLYMNGLVPTVESSRYMVRLCYHFRKKIEVEYDDTHGFAKFPWGVCRLTALVDAIQFECEADDAGKMAQIQYVIDSHVELFSRKAPMSVVWEAMQNKPAS